MICAKYMANKNLLVEVELPIFNHIVQKMLVEQISKLILHGQADFIDKIVQFDGFGQLQ